MEALDHAEGQAEGERGVVRQRVDGRADFNNQLILDRCFIEYEGESEDFPMTARWLFKEEFQLLLRLAGFERWECFGTPEGSRLDRGAAGRRAGAPEGSARVREDAREVKPKNPRAGARGFRRTGVPDLGS